VSSVTPEPDRVKVVLSLPKGTKVPLDAQAYIVPPSVISDRYVGLSPAWNGTQQLMPDGYTLQGYRTHVPAEFDQLVGSLTTLFKALGPKEANAKGAVGQLIKVLSDNLAGNGQRIHDTIEGLAGATGALTNDSGGVAAVINNLDKLSRNLAARDQLVGSFESDLAAASSELAGERTDITSVVDNLSSGLVALSTFIRAHRTALHGDLTNLVVTTNLLLQHQRALIETLDNLPLAAQNLSRVDRNGSIVVKQAQAGDNQEFAQDLAKICGVLGPVCMLLTAEPKAAGTAEPKAGTGSASPAKSDSGSLAPLFGGAQ
jgi:phospholipid/cholesterol/gamma-HCH transport system substrate-binding protein